ncbi:MAG: hypothetical protein K1W24_05505 [Lachnospiraceae bacterium]
MESILISVIKKAFIIISLCFILCLQGCGNGKDLKDNIIKGYNNFIEHAGAHALTKNSKLNGTREFGSDNYTGNYKVSYKDFNGEEYIFGGTSLERDNGSNLEAVYTLNVESGEAGIYYIAAGEEYLIASGSTEGEYKFAISPGDNYIIVRGKNFSGTLDLAVQDVISG